MKARPILSICAILLAGIKGVEANDVFVYTTGSHTPVKTLKNLRSIVYGSNGIQLNAKDGSSEEVAYADFDYFRFFATPIPTYIRTAETDEASIVFANGKLKIQTRQAMERVDVISTAGEVLAQMKPESTYANYDIASLPAGTLLIKVVAGNNTYVKKIIKK